MKDVGAEYVRTAARELGVELTWPEIDALETHLRMVLEANERVNLTAITDYSSAIRLHVVDSIAVIPHIRDLPGHIADIGTGGGYPGIPIAIVLREGVDLVESIGKKANILNAFLQDLGGLHGSRVIQRRAEELASEAPGSYGRIVARAVTSLPALVELASPLLVHGGTLVAMKGCPEVGEIESGRVAAGIVGLAEESVTEYQLPESSEMRTIVRYEKQRDSRIPLPRRPGVAQRRPLA